MMNPWTKDFICGEDGFWFFWPEGNNGGFSAYDLKIIADELDNLNKPWEDSIIEFFRNNPQEDEQIRTI